MIEGKQMEKETNYEQVMWELAGSSPWRNVEHLPDDVLRYIACPLEIDPEADVMEHEDKPTASQCAACKRRWLQQEAK